MIEELIESELENWKSNPVEYLGLPYTPEDALSDPVQYHNNRNYDAFFPPLFTFGNFDKYASNKVVLLSLEPHKKGAIRNGQLDLDGDFFTQARLLRGLNRDQILTDYRSTDINHSAWRNYQLNYFDYFPSLFRDSGNDRYPDAYNHSYWRYIAHLTKGALGEDGFNGDVPLRDNGWETLSKGLIEFPVFPMVAKSHPGVNFNDRIRELLWQRLLLVKPKAVVLLARSYENVIIPYLGLEGQNSESFTHGDRIIHKYTLNANGITCPFFTGDALASWGAWGPNGKYGFAYQIGQLIYQH